MNDTDIEYEIINNCGRNIETDGNSNLNLTANIFRAIKDESLPTLPSERTGGMKVAKMSLEKGLLYRDS